MIADTFDHVDSGVNDYEVLSDIVEEYLWNGVVPSTVFHKGALRHPQMTTILNSASKVHISTLDELLSRIEGGDPSSPMNCAEWTQRVELWAMKALEDSVVLNRGK